MFQFSSPVLLQLSRGALSINLGYNPITPTPIYLFPIFNIKSLCFAYLLSDSPPISTCSLSFQGIEWSHRYCMMRSHFSSDLAAVHLFTLHTYLLGTGYQHMISRGS
ncbi:hypothetical protein HD806DRAFT_473654 [Xylariaceae sp. AK1471]|nr:hypothetical protein HD806DRAFT_473654 [Xylariaceae sp. AK1471]